MSTETEIRAAVESGSNSISPETAEKFRQQMEARGLDPSATLTKHGVGATPSPGDQPQPKARSYAPDIGPDGLPRLNAAQVEQAAATLRAHWTGSPEELEAALAAAGAKPMASAVPDTRTDEEREFDNSSLGSARPEEYALGGLYLSRDVDLATLAAQDRTLRASLSELSVPKGLGKVTAEAFLESADAYAKIAAQGDAAVKQYYANESALFARVNKISWAEASAVLKPWLATKSQATRDYLAKPGVVESAVARTRLYQAYTLAQARAGMKGRK